MGCVGVVGNVPGVELGGGHMEVEWLEELMGKG